MLRFPSLERTARKHSFTSGFSRKCCSPFRPYIEELEQRCLLATTIASYLSLTAPSLLDGSPSITVRALSQSNRIATSYLGTISFTSSDPLAVLPPSYTFTVADLGVHTFSGVQISTDNQTISATATGNG